MMNAQKVKALSVSEPVDMESIWADAMADSDFSFDIKAQSVCTDLARAAGELGFSQADIARKLGWSPARVSRVFHGSANLTLKTLHEVANALNLEFDVIYRGVGQVRSPQPWEQVVMLENAADVCKKIEDLHAVAQDNLSESEAILGTARMLSRRIWSFAQKVETKKAPKNIGLNVAYG